ncbi:MAG: ribonuclease P protein component [Planctomycetaceae bacterium]|nr:ribonuclease P protein component [Planctomycetaceae bacterium]
MTQRFLFRPHQRLRTAADYQLVYDAGFRAGDQTLLVFVRPNGLDWSRLGTSVSRKHGNSVVRHRLKRWIREAFRLQQFDLPVGYDLIVIPRQGNIASQEEVHRALPFVVKRAVKRIPATDQPATNNDD